MFKNPDCSTLHEGVMFRAIYFTEILMCILRQVPEEMRYRFIKDMTLKIGVSTKIRNLDISLLV